MSAPIVFIVIGLAMALAEEFVAQGRSLVGWAVMFVCLGLLWGRLG